MGKLIYGTGLLIVASVEVGLHYGFGMGIATCCTLLFICITK
jgi:hypothetical protein